MGINYPSTDTTYHAYIGTTYTISFGQTVYSGTLDVVNGVLTITHGIVTDLGSQYWVIHSAGDYIFRTTIEGIKQPSSTDRNKDIICSCYKPSSVTAINSTMDNEGMLIANGNLYIRDTSYSDVTVFKTSLNNQSFVYPLATPIRINLNKTQITTLLEENIIYANSGNISIDYFTQSGKEISDIANSSNKMDFVNPTGVGSLSLNRAGGTAIGNYSVALGVNCEASGLRSYAEGYYTKASGSVSHAEGRSTIANHWAQHVFGAYNIEDPSSESSSSKGNYVEIVGNGTSTTPSNARTLDWNGNETLAGDLTIKGNVSVGDAITLNTSGTASRRITDISVTRSKIVKFNGIKFFNATIRADAAVSGGTSILDVSTGFESASQQSLLVTASTGGTIQAYISGSTITTTNASALVTDTVYYIIGWYT